MGLQPLLQTLRLYYICLHLVACLFETYLIVSYDVPSIICVAINMIFESSSQ